MKPLITLVFSTFALTFAQGGGPGQPPAAAGPMSLTGTLYAPAGHDVSGTVIIACFVAGDDCDETRSQTTQISQSGERTTFAFDSLSSDPYALLAWKDSNANGVLDDGDLSAFYTTSGPDATPVVPPAHGLKLHLSVVGAGDSSPLEPGVVKGTVRSSQGQPLAGVHIEIRDASYRYSSLHATTDATGAYRVVLPVGSWIALATHMITYHGAQHCLHLERDSHEGFWHADGAIRDFTVRISGERRYADGTTGYWGGKLDVQTGFGKDPWGNDPLEATVRLILTPDGPLMDGSAGERLEYTGTVNLRDDFSVHDIPLGRYRVEAIVLDPSGATIPLKVRAYRDDRRQDDALIAFDDPTGLGCDATKWSVVDLLPNN